MAAQAILESKEEVPLALLPIEKFLGLDTLFIEFVASSALPLNVPLTYQAPLPERSTNSKQ
jgi:hypothetical protein